MIVGDAARTAGKWGGVISPDNTARRAGREAAFVVWHQEMTLLKQKLAAEVACIRDHCEWQPVER